MSENLSIPKLFLNVEKEHEVAFQKLLLTNPSKFNNKIVFVNGAKSNYIVVNGTKFGEFIPMESFDNEKTVMTVAALNNALTTLKPGEETLINIASNDVLNIDAPISVPTGAVVTLNIVDTKLSLCSTAGNYGFEIAEGASLIMRGGDFINEDKKVRMFKNSGSLTIESGNYDAYIIVDSLDGCDTVITGGTFNTVEPAVLLSCANSSLSISGGEFTTEDNAAIMDNGLEKNSGNVITITGGKFNCNIKSAGYIACGVYVSNDNFAYLYGGEFNVTNGCGVLARSGQTVIDGATFNITGNITGKVGDSKTAIECAGVVFDEMSKYPTLSEDSCVVIENAYINVENGIEYCVLEESGAHKHNDEIIDRIIKPGVPVTSKEELATALATGGQIVLENDVKTSALINIKKDTVIDLGGNVLSRENVDNGSSNTSSPVIYASAGKLTLTNGSVITEGSIDSVSMTSVWAGGADIEILNGEYYGGCWKLGQDVPEGNASSPTIYVTQGTVTIKGGTFEGGIDNKGFATTQANILNVIDSAYKNGTGNIIVMGGKFLNFNPANNVSEGKGTNFVAEGYKVIANGKETTEQWTLGMMDTWYEVVEA